MDASDEARTIDIGAQVPTLINFLHMTRVMGVSSKLIAIGLAAIVSAGSLEPTSTSELPDYFQTSFGPYAGPTQVGSAPFLAQINPAPFGNHSYVPNTPIVTDVPIIGKADSAGIFKYMGNLSPYMPNPSGFGVEEYPLPPGSNITQMHMIHRHGSRYPTFGDPVPVVYFHTRISELLGNGTRFTGNLSFLNDWKYELGTEELTALGRQQLFDSGVLHWFNYGRLYDSSVPLIARTTTEARMLQSAENFLNGFFGPNWTQNVTLEVLIESSGFNNSLAGNEACNNSHTDRGYVGDGASTQWRNKYLQQATERFRQSMTGNGNWTIEDTYIAQTMCPYETVGLGYSPFCSLFTWDEWLGFEYSLDVSYYGSFGFGSPVARALGIGYVEELVARLLQHYPQPDDDSIALNETLDDNARTFPLDQTLYLDFSHDTNMVAVLTALGLTQFAEFLPLSGPPQNHQLITSHLVPFAGRLNIEVIRTPRPVMAQRSEQPADSVYESTGDETIYVHMLINQRTIPLGRSISECGQRDDGWCEMKTFIKAQQENIVKANYEESCFGDYPVPEYGNITTGAI